MATEKRLIDANEVVRMIRNSKQDNPYSGTLCGVAWEMAHDCAISCVEAESATVDAVEVVHGRWFVDKEHLRATCSECGKTLRFSDEMQIAFLTDVERFCYYCGAKMDGGNDNGKE